MHIYFTSIKTKRITPAFTHQVTVETELPEDGADERRFASEYQPKSEIFFYERQCIKLWCNEGTVNMNTLHGIKAVERVSKTHNGYLTTYNFNWDTRWSSWMKHLATCRKVAGSFSDDVFLPAAQWL